MAHVPPYIASLRPYVPGQSIAELQRTTGAQRIIKLASNENPFGPSPKALAAMTSALTRAHRYPDSGTDLKIAIAERLRIHTDNVILAGGSDSLMMTLVRVFVTPGGEVVTSAGSFPQFTLMSRSQGAVVKTAPLKHYRYDLVAMARLITPQTQVVFLANPNNPTGTIFTHAEWEVFYHAVAKETLIVMDEAYAEFVMGDPEWPDSMRDRFDNVITLRTFSKAYGLAGVRLGYGMGHAPLIRELHKVKLPFEPSVLALAAGAAALADEAFVRESVALVCAERREITKRLTSIGLEVVPSKANFVMTVFPDIETAQRVHAGLLARGIIVRPLQAFGLPAAIRITIGLPEENRACCDTIAALLYKSA